MISKRMLFCLYCLLLWPAAIFVACNLESYLSVVLWWLAVQARATTLSKTVFSVDAWLPIVIAEGLLLGFVPLNQLVSWTASAFGRLGYSSSREPSTELRPYRPLLWAWTLPTLAFLMRFLLYGVQRDRSVLATSRFLEPAVSRISHFFGPITFAVSQEYTAWLYDRMFLTTPMLFLIAYSAAVWLRHHMPDHLGQNGKPAGTLGS